MTTNDAASPVTLHDRLRAWASVASNAIRGDGTTRIVRLAVATVAVLTAIGLAVAIGIGLVLVVLRAGDAIGEAFTATAPLLGRILGYMFIAAVVIGSAILFLAVLAASTRLAGLAIAAMTREAAGKVSRQHLRYANAALLLLAPAAAIYVVLAQPGFQALPLELKQYLFPLVLPFALGAASAPVWGRGPAIALTLVAALTVAGIIVAVGYLEPLPAPDLLIARWVELMRAAPAMPRLFWMALGVLAIVVWTIAVFVGYRESFRAALAPSEAPTAYVPAPDPWTAPRRPERVAPAPT
ncbi:MAG: hypothetical protein JNJ73_03800 [Hyphomonadaceae bacterium]|nr:hypothetical protein [Hyphomonadaceae bacterium]